MAQKKYSIKEMVAASGLTTRTLQHYDNIGLLPARRTEGGRRFYTEADLIKLEQIIFYKSLGFSLNQIQENLISPPDLPAMERILSAQARILYRQIEAMHTSLAALEACQEVIKTKRIPPWKFLSSFISQLGQKDFHSWDFSTLDPKVLQEISAHFPNLEAVVGLLHTWKKLSIKAAVFKAAGVGPVEPAAQELAAEWMKMAHAATSGDAKLLKGFLAIDQNRETWPEGARKLMEEADDYISECYRVYCERNGLEPVW